MARQSHASHRARRLLVTAACHVLHSHESVSSCCFCVSCAPLQETACLANAHIKADCMTIVNTQKEQMQMLFEPSWGMLELELATVMHRTIKSYGALYTQQDPSNLYKPVPLVSRSHFLYWTWLVVSLPHPPPPPPPPGRVALTHRDFPCELRSSLV